MDELKEFIAKLADGNSLNRNESETAFSILMSGQATPAQIGGFLMALRVRGESVAEFTGAVSVMRSKMLCVDAPTDAIDIVGTGGDCSGTYNISTCAAIVAAGAGLKVAKHGNRSLSSKSGAAEVLVALGVNLELSPGQISDCIEEAGIGFMFAPKHHSAMRHVGPIRIELATRTIFNLLGPMCNPAGVKRQLIGVFSPKWLLPIAQTLAELGSQKVWVTYGGGLDEITITGPTHVAALDNGNISTFDITPQDGGLPVHDMKEILGGDAHYNAAAITRVLDGEACALRDIALLNAGAAMIIADKAENLDDGVYQSAQAIDNGNARAALDKLIRISGQGKC